MPINKLDMNTNYKIIILFFFIVFTYNNIYALSPSTPSQYGNETISLKKIMPKSTRSSVTLEDAAAFALLVYGDKKNFPPIPEGFKLLCKCPIKFQNKNYYGEAYYRFEYGTYINGHVSNTPSKVTVVIAHRGTILNIDNLADDMLIALKNAPDAFIESSKQFTDYVRTLAYSNFSHDDFALGIDFVHVGHSLGAIHAELNYDYMQKTEYSDVHAITFESPGSLEIMENLVSRKVLPDNSVWWAWSIQQIISDINLINSTNKHVGGGINRITPGYDFINLPKIDFTPTDFKYFATYFTLDQHSMAKIYKYFKNGGQIMHIGGKYPNNPFEAFRYYKTYNPDNDEHQEYWDQAFQFYWDNHQEIHSGYNYNVNEYRKYMIDHYLYRNNL